MTTEAICISCGCSDNNACQVPGRDKKKYPCGWVVVDRKAGVGICSAQECRTAFQRWDAGDRKLSDKAKLRAVARVQ